MSSMLPASGQLDEIEREFAPEPIGKHMLWAIGFHVLLIAGAAAFALIHGLMPHYMGGGGSQDNAIAVKLVSNALPLPNDRPPNDNVLATETPSEAPAAPAPKAKAAVDESAIPIANKMQQLKKPADKKQVASNAKPQITPPLTKTPPRTQPVKPDNRAQYGEQSSSQMQRATQSNTSTTIGSVTASSGGTKGFPYPFYLQGIERKMQENVNRAEVDPRTPKGAQTTIFFTIKRDGSPTDLKLVKSSGSPTLDRACMHGLPRIDTFGPLPSPPSDGVLYVTHDCFNN